MKLSPANFKYQMVPYANDYQVFSVQVAAHSILLFAKMIGMWRWELYKSYQKPLIFDGERRLDTNKINGGN